MDNKSTNDTGGGKLTMSPTDKKSVSGAIVGNVCILIATIFWGMNVAVTKALIPDWMTADGIAAVRLIGGAGLFWLVSIFIKDKPIEHEDWLKLFLGGAIGLFLFIFLFVTSLRFGSAIDISIIMTLPPIFVIVMEIIFCKRRPAMLEYLGIVVSFAGAAFVIASNGSGSGSGSNPLLGDLLAIASAACYAFYLFILEGPTKKYRPSNMLRWVFLFAAVPALCLVPGMKDMPIMSTTDARPWIEIGFILLCPTFIAYFLVQPAIKHIGSELVSIYQYLTPVFATLTAVLMGIGKLHWTQVGAMIIIIAGMLLTNRGKNVKPATSNAGSGK
ncbi:MAG: DMT family transporter [Muribaculaceae bacterium]|nr:DMT family transporter [Muribaculaceae bacterium]MDE5856827.1 DMT family transporter [Muribaculaceae bacterium]MDE7156146.1 DMT family transporter [Muribaculaceae bacterium]MDE7368584.1 DMT family transporter [Muribaculaceae bacterium]